MGNTNGQSLGSGGFRVYLNQLWDGTSPFTVEQLVTAVEATTTLRELIILNEDFYEPTPEYQGRVMEPLCRCIANLRRRNAQHPLTTLSLSASAYTDDQTIRPFLEAAKKGGIAKIFIQSVRNLNTEYFVHFCRSHKKLKSFKVWNVSMTAQTFDECDGSGDPLLHLKQLSLRDICFRSVRAATLFENLAGDMKLVGLELGKITIRDGDDDGLGNDMDRDDDDFDPTHGLEDAPEAADVGGAGGNDDEDDNGADDEDDVDNDSNERFYGTDFYWPYDPKMSSRIVTKLIKPSVEELYLTRMCRKTHFQAALKAAKNSVIYLWVDVHRSLPWKRRTLANAVRDVHQLHSLRVRNQGSGIGQIAISGGTSILYGGTLIGTISGGSGTPLVISLNSNANAAAVRALTRNITFETSGTIPSLRQRTISFQLSDGQGGVSVAVTKFVKVSRN